MWTSPASGTCADGVTIALVVASASGVEVGAAAFLINAGRDPQKHKDTNTEAIAICQQGGIHSDLL